MRKLRNHKLEVRQPINIDAIAMVLDALVSNQEEENNWGLTVKEIVGATGLGVEVVRTRLFMLINQGKVVQTQSYPKQYILAKNYAKT